MTLIVKSSSDDIISLPARLMESLNLREGENIKTIVEGRTLRLEPIDQFLALRGALQDDEDFGCVSHG